MAKSTDNGTAEGAAEEKTAAFEPLATVAVPVADLAAPAASAVDEPEAQPEPDHPDARRQSFLGRLAALKSRAMLASRQHDLQGLAGVMSEFFDLVADQAR